MHPEDQIAFEEKEKYERVWAELDEYRLGRQVDYLTLIFLRFFEPEIRPKQRVIDFGCGSGRSSIFLSEANLSVDLVDFAGNCLDTEIFLTTAKPGSNVCFVEGCLWNLPDSLSPAEWGICFNVLEHIPTEKIERVLDHMSQKITQGALVAIDLNEDSMGKKLGQTLHLTIQPSSWWIERIEKKFLIRKILLDEEGKFVVALSNR